MSGHFAHVSEEVLRGLPSKVSRVTQGTLLAIGISGTGISIAGEWFHGRHVINEWLLDNFSIVGAVLNILLISLVLLPGSIKKLPDDFQDPVARHAARCLNQFCLPALEWFWRFLGLAYVALLYGTLLGNHRHSPIALSVGHRAFDMLPTMALELFSCGSTFAIAVAYSSLTPSFLRAYVTEAQNGTNSTPSPWTRWRDSSAIWTCAAWVIPIAAMVLLTRLFPLGLGVLVPPLSLDTFVTVIVSYASAVALAFFVGRLDSKFALNWQWVIPLLFCYAGIQMYSLVLSDPARLESAAYTYAAFTMKCVLYTFLSSFFESRRVLYYAVELVDGGDRTL